MLIWLVALCRSGVIIGLAIANGRQKRIQELTCQLERQRLYGLRGRKPGGEMPPDPPNLKRCQTDGWCRHP
ncbi:hypothetical protein [Enterocloster sp.]|uniref:hypothetical protein n=1 Tax=Enterocloster sp. TaxID=2719315 RepID=UPI0039A393DE